MRLLIMVGLSAWGCLAQAQLITIPAGTKIPLTLTSALGTRTARVGDPVRAETTFPVAIGGEVAIPNGTFVEGAIDQVRRRGRNAGFDMHFTRLIFANGYTPSFAGSSTVPGGAGAASPGPPAAPAPGMASNLQASQGLTPPAPVGPNKGLIIGLAAGGAATAIITAVVFGRRGGGVYLDVGSALEMVLANPLLLDKAKLAPGP
jgi:hypothetical protein